MMNLCVKGQVIYGEMSLDRWQVLSRRIDAPVVARRRNKYWHMRIRAQIDYSYLAQAMFTEARGIDILGGQYVVFRLRTGIPAREMTSEQTVNELKKALRWFRLAGENEIERITVWSPENFERMIVGLDRIDLLYGQQVFRLQRRESKFAAVKIPTEQKQKTLQHVSEVLCIKSALQKHMV